MDRRIGIRLALLAGVAIGAVAVAGVHAQGKAPGTYAVVDVTAVTNPDVFRRWVPEQDLRWRALAANTAPARRTSSRSTAPRPSDSSSLASTASTKREPGTLLQPQEEVDEILKNRPTRVC